MTLPLQVRSYQSDLYTQALSSIWMFYDRVRDPSYALAQDVDYWEVLQRDAKIKQGIIERLHAVAGPDWTVVPFNNSKEKADITLARVCEELLKRIPHFADFRVRAAQAIFQGQSSHLICGKRKPVNIAGLGMRQWWLPTQLRHVDHRRFTIRPVREERPDGTLRVRGELWMSTIPMYSHTGKPPGPDAVRGDTAPSAILAGYRKVEHPGHFVRIVYGDEECRLGYGRGMFDSLYFYAWVKTVLMREGLQGVERWSQGIVVGKIDEDRVGEADTQTMEKERTKMLDALTAMRARHVLVTGRKDEVEVITGGGEGYQIVQGMLDYVDDCIMAVCTGAVLMSSKSNAGSSGSHARDEVGRETQRGVILYDRGKVDEDISTDLIGLVIRTNWRNLQSMGLAQAAANGAPQFKTVDPKHSDPDRGVARIAQLAQIATASGRPIPVRTDELYALSGFTPVTPDDDFIMLGMAPQPMAPMGMEEGMDEGAPSGGGGGVATDAGGHTVPSIGQPPRGAPMRMRALEDKVDGVVARLKADMEAGFRLLAAELKPAPQAPAQPAITFGLEKVVVDSEAIRKSAAAAIRAEVAGLDTSITEKVQAAFKKELDDMKIDVHIPQQAASVVHVAAPKVEVNVPAPVVNVEAPVVHVDVPAPVVHVDAPIIHVDAPAAPPAPKTKEVIVRRQQDGSLKAEIKQT